MYYNNDNYKKMTQIGKQFSKKGICDINIDNCFNKYNNKTKKFNKNDYVVYKADNYGDYYWINKITNIVDDKLKITGMKGKLISQNNAIPFNKKYFNNILINSLKKFEK